MMGRANDDGPCALLFYYLCPDSRQPGGDPHGRDVGNLAIENGERRYRNVRSVARMHGNMT
jgi:hypothetical protein